MSKNFEGEYKEYLNAQAPDLWDRIEAGVDALGSAGQEKVTPITAGQAKKEKKKRRIRYQNYRMLVSVAACLFALILVVPVYFLTRNSGKDASSEAPMMMADGAIENVEITNEESAVVTEEAAPAEEVAEPAAEAEIALEETQEDALKFAQGTGEAVKEEDAEGVGEISDMLDETSTGQLVLSDAEETDGILPEAAQEKVPAQEDMQVTILGVGDPAEGGVVYTATRADEASAQPVMLFVSADSGIVFEVNKMYHVTVEMAEGNSYYRVIDMMADE